MRTSHSTLLMIVLTGAALCGPVHAQWKWRDTDGRMHYSDQPPPLSVPPGRILASGSLLRKPLAAPMAAGEQAPAANADAPGGAAAAPTAKEGGTVPPQAVASAADAGKAAQGDDRPARTPAERLTELRKRLAEKEEADRKANEQREAQARMAQWCDQNQSQARLLESGLRVAGMNAEGERTTLADDERQGRLETLRKDYAQHCSKS